MALSIFRKLFQRDLKVLFTQILFLFSFTCFAQDETRLIFFTDKNNSPFSADAPEEFLSARAIERREKFNISVDETDLPVNPQYLQSVSSTGARVVYSSRWLNAALVKGTQDQLNAATSFSFVYGAEDLKLGDASLAGDQGDVSKISADYGNSAHQLQMLDIPQMHTDGYKGDGKLIAVLDAGFQNVNTIQAFDSLRAGRLSDTYDFPDNQQDVFDNHDHGTKVLSALAAYREGSIIGGAWKASYLLYRTENVSYEKEIEEVYWLLAAERADSAGADIIQSSVGYNIFPDDPSANHTISELDGNTAIITQAADLAAEKGILVINSAGNEGESPWKYILFPADGDYVLTVGGVTFTGESVAGSSEGPTADGRIKPDVVAMSSGVVVVSGGGMLTTASGTSFAAPLVTGLAAGLWQRFPHLTNMEIIQLIRESADQFHAPDNKKGYGIPGYTKAVQLLNVKNSMGKAEVKAFPNPVSAMVDLVFPDDFKEEVTVRLHDTAGRVVIYKTLSLSGATIRLDLSSVEPGLYTGAVESDASVWNFKLVKAAR